MGLKFGRYFTILDLEHSTDDKQELFGMWAPDNIWHASAKQLWRTLAPMAKCAVIESDYIDADHRSGVSRFHFLQHRDLERRCKRIHFFGCQLDRQDLRQLTPDVSDEYLGFSVLRPFSSNRLGRSLLADRLAPGAGTGTDLTTHVTCTARYQVNLAGNEIVFSATPWMHSRTPWCPAVHRRHYGYVADI